ncbi:hypothetical protein PTKIN_Ptkin15bG0082800 [Pterospermum kingtungense]
MEISGFWVQTTEAARQFLWLFELVWEGLELGGSEAVGTWGTGQKLYSFCIVASQT